MASFLAGSAAGLVGAGMKAAGVGIPVSETAERVIDGLRDGLGLPLPPKSWFKRRGSAPEAGPSAKSPGRNVYETLEQHVHGMIKVARPVIELKGMVREGCCRRATRRASARERSPSPSTSIYYTPQKCTSDGGCRRHSGSDSKSPQSKNTRKSCRRRNSRNSDGDDTCTYCSRSRPEFELPCGRLICSKCDKTEDHDLKSKMPRRSSQVPETVDFIDLTQDSPANIGLRLSRNRRRVSEVLNETDMLDDEPIPVEQSNSKKQRLQKSSVIINLDETINLDDSSNNANIKKSTAVISHSKSSPEKKEKSLSCPICLENLEDENVKAMTTPCGHIFCLECLKKVTNSKRKCSICQRSISFTKCIRLHI